MPLPTDPKQRKAVPLFSGLIKYFPDALAAVAECSQAGNDQHNPGQPLHWAREKSGDELDALTRHLFQAGEIDSDNIRHSAKIAWRALANLQKEIEASQPTKNDLPVIRFGTTCATGVASIKEDSHVDAATL